MKSTKSEIISLLSNHKGGLLAASHWPSIRPLAQLRIFWQPTNNVDHVLPKECEPSNEGKEIDLARFGLIYHT